MPSCFAPDCNHVSRRETCRFYRFPKNPKTFKSWEDMCRRADRNANYEDRVCSCHFLEGKKENGPTIFKRNIEKRFDFPDLKKRKKICSSEPSTSALESSYSALETSTSAFESSTSALESSPPALESSTSALEPLPKVNLNTHMTPPSTSVSNSVILLEAEIYFLKKEIDELKKKLSVEEKRLTFAEVKSSHDLLYKYTGLPDVAHFESLFNVISNYDMKYFAGWTVKQIPPEDQLLCTLMKLRLNLQNFDLAFRFKVSDTTIHNVVITYIYAIYDILYKTIISEIPSKEENALCLPFCFLDFPNCRIVLDCIEIKIATPHETDKQKNVFSHYKQRHTFKVLIGVAPNGTITFVSDLYPGSTSDTEITRGSGVLDQMVPGDMIIASKGFLISELCAPLGVTVNTPPFLQNPQFTAEEATKIARARIYAQKAITRLKSYRILDFIMPSMKPHASHIIKACAALVNFQNPLKGSEEIITPDLLE